MQVLLGPYREFSKKRQNEDDSLVSTVPLFFALEIYCFFDLVDGADEDTFRISFVLTGPEGHRHQWTGQKTYRLQQKRTLGVEDVLFQLC
jgi:hypothetical protein